MNYFKKLRIKIGAFLLKLKLRKVKHDTIICNLTQAKYIGIVFNSLSENQIKVVKKVETYYHSKNINVETLGFCNLKKCNETHIGDKNHHFVSLLDFNWFFQAKSEILKNFINKEFNILINLYNEDEFPLEYILKTSNAGFKVGSANTNNEMHDLMIDVGKRKDDIEYLSEQMNHYLNIINN